MTRVYFKVVAIALAITFAFISCDKSEVNNKIIEDTSEV